ncbi:MAG: hypothetical protein AB7N91_01775 [Candidatus Tectimicrobiota bacterium]
MVDTPLPGAVQAFLLRQIDSIAHLEALLLLRAHADTPWSADALAQRLYITVQDTAAILARLEADGFLVALSRQPPLYQYHCAAAAQADLVDEVAACYAKYLIPVTHLIHNKPRPQVQAFAEAFKLRKEE